MNQHELIQPGLADLPLARADVTERVWAALLACADGEAGVQAEPGWSAEERAAAALYGPLLGRGAGRPYIVAQVGQSLDGRIATPDGDAQHVSGRDGIAHLHRCRALADAVVIGVGTAVADDPRLTVRLAAGRSPARIVIDPSGRLGNDAVVFRDDGCRRIVVQACGRRQSAGVEVVELPLRGDMLDPCEIAGALDGLGFRRVLIEGGGTTIGRFLDAELVDRLHIGIAPLIIGAGPSGLNAMPPPRLIEARRPKAHVYGLGTDLIVDCAFGGA
ncbi:RibD family protein [Aquamicrobium terrae]|uniref:Riboflavin-specific deaminase-like protein n=1 Tax=Aquamicrobium terrae TaxID=1324945 RepID=A0ABV2N4K2_9HYPH